MPSEVESCTHKTNSYSQTLQVKMNPRQNRGLRSRKWFGTVWSEIDLNNIRALKYQYLLISALDTTSHDHEDRLQDHWHVFIQFKSNRTRPRTMTAHWEVPANIRGAIDYCKSKGEPTFEEGDA